MNLFFLLSTLFSALFAEESAQWNALPARTSGWLAADGIYSVAAPDEKSVYFLFSDTLCGSTQNQGRDFGDVYMVNHSMMRLGKQEDGEFGKDAQCFMPPKGENLLRYRCWLQDGTFFKGKLVFTTLDCDPETWKPRRVDWVELPLLSDGIPDFQNAAIQRDVPIFYDSPEVQIVFGAAFTEDSEESSESTDEFVYIFGYIDRKRNSSRKDLAAARVEREKLNDFRAWRFWDGNGWNPEITTCASLAEGISTEFSVSRIPSGPRKGEFLLVDTRGGISPIVEGRVGRTPIGPYDAPQILFRAPEHGADGLYTYNAKAHPALSTSETLILTYNVNRFGDLPHHPQEYRPRFLQIRYTDIPPRTATDKCGEF